LSVTGNIWLLGYSMADSHDHGLYLGPLNIQIEYDKFYDQPLGNEGPLYLVHQAFLSWRRSAASRLAIPVRTRGYLMQHILLTVDGINPAINAFLTSNELKVVVDWDGQNWDTLLSLDVTPLRSAGGYICECCEPERRTVFPTLESLLRDHLFEPFLAWVNGELAVADTIGLYGSPADGYTQAKLLHREDLSRGSPGRVIALRTTKSAG
jgi:hypothetical protein